MFSFRTYGPDPIPSAPATQQNQARGEVVELREEVERLYFITEALWRILREKHALDENEIIRQITAIDLEDGKLDGRKARNPPQPCPKCNRILARQRSRCMFCGELIAVSPFER